MAAEKKSKKEKGVPHSTTSKSKGRSPQPKSWAFDAQGNLVNWDDAKTVTAVVTTNLADDSWKEEIQPADWVESKALGWLKELDAIAKEVMVPHGPYNMPDYDLAAKIRLALVKFSSVNRQRIDMTAQIAMTAPVDLSRLKDEELKAIELGDNSQLNELALRIGALKSARPRSDDDAT